MHSFRASGCSASTVVRAKKEEDETIVYQELTFVEEAAGETAAGMLTLPFKMVFKICLEKQFDIINLFSHCCRFFRFSQFVMQRFDTNDKVVQGRSCQDQKGT